MSEPSIKTLAKSAMHAGYLKGLGVAVDLSNKMLSQTKEKRAYRLELIRLMNEDEKA
jgi:hypothetical protein